MFLTLNSHLLTCKSDRLSRTICPCWLDRHNQVYFTFQFATILLAIFLLVLILILPTCLEKHATRCCTDDGQLITTNPHKTCFPILIPQNDPAHSQTNMQCMNFVRTLTDKDLNCVDTLPQHPAEQMTVVTAFMDLSLVYGNNEDQNRPIRAFHGGRL